MQFFIFYNKINIIHYLSISFCRDTWCIHVRYFSERPFVASVGASISISGGNRWTGIEPSSVAGVLVTCRKACCRLRFHASDASAYAGGVTRRSDRYSDRQSSDTEGTSQLYHPGLARTSSRHRDIPTYKKLNFQMTWIFKPLFTLPLSDNRPPNISFAVTLHIY